MLITKENNLVTFINVFETKPEQQQEFIEHWMRFVDSVKGEPSMLGTALHKSTDGTRVVNYAHWRSEADLDTFTKKYTEFWEADHRPLVLRADPHTYEVVYLYERAEP